MELCDHICYRRLTRLSTVARCSTYSWFLSLALTEGDANRARWLEKYIHENIWEIWEMHPHHLDHGFLLLPWWHCLLWEPSHLQPLIRPHQRQCFLSALLCLISCRYHSVHFLVQLISLQSRNTLVCFRCAEFVSVFFYNCVSLTVWQEQMLGVLQIHTHCS